MKFIGMDVHSSTTDICVVNSKGEKVLQRRVDSDAEELVDFIVSIDGPKQVALEESQMADWVTRALEPHVQRVVRCLPQHNRLISQSENKCDEQDAYALALLLYLNQLKEVHHPDWKFRQLRETVRHYWRSSRDQSRAKNRLSAYLLWQGVKPIRGKCIYSRRDREAYCLRLRLRQANVAIAESLWQDIDYCRRKKAVHLRLMRQMARQMGDDVKRLQSIPGVGLVGACTLLAYLEGGHRFSNKRQVWRYSNLAVRQRGSAGKSIQGASREGNRYVKNAVLTATASIATGQKKHALWHMWQRGLAQGVDARRMRRNLGRKILVIAQYLLRSQQEYQDDCLMANTSAPTS